MGRPSYGWFVVAASFVNLFMVYGIVFSIGLYFKPMMDEFNLSTTQLSLFVSLLLPPSFVNLFMVYGIVFSIGLYFKPMMDEFNWSRTELSLGVSLFMLAFGFSQPVMGRLIDRYGPKTVLS